MKGADLMTHREAYAFGWVYGILNARLKHPIDTTFASQRPFTGNAKIIFNAHQENIMTPELDKKIAAALSEITFIEPESTEGTEVFQPPIIQGSWLLGYYAGYSGKEMSPPFDLVRARKNAGMTQKQLAEAVGIDQAVVSRIESGKLEPHLELLEKLKAAVSK